MGNRILNNLSIFRSNRLIPPSSEPLSNSFNRLSSIISSISSNEKIEAIKISEQLRKQINELKLSIQNTSNVNNAVKTAEIGLLQINNHLISMRKLATDSTQQNNAKKIFSNQNEINKAVLSINQIANTTQYSEKKLLNGDSNFTISNKPSNIKEIQISRVVFHENSNLDIPFEIKAPAELAKTEIEIGSNILQSNSDILINGPEGKQIFTFAKGTPIHQIANQINEEIFNTGVKALAKENSIFFSSTAAGSHIKVSIIDQDSDGFILGNAYNATNNKPIIEVSGSDIEGTINGILGQGNGNKLTISSNNFTGQITFEDSNDNEKGVFTIDNNGLTFQLAGYQNTEKESIGINNVSAENLGSKSGNLFTITKDNANDLDNNPNRAITIIDEAITEINSTFAQLKNFQTDVLDVNSKNILVAIENIIASNNRLHDLDFAAETALFTRTKILVQSRPSILAQANTNSNSVIDLLK